MIKTMTKVSWWGKDLLGFQTLMASRLPREAKAGSQAETKEECCYLTAPLLVSSFFFFAFSFGCWQKPTWASSCTLDFLTFSVQVSSLPCSCLMPCGLPGCQFNLKDMVPASVPPSTLLFPLFLSHPSPRVPFPSLFTFSEELLGLILANAGVFLLNSNKIIAELSS